MKVSLSSADNNKNVNFTGYKWVKDEKGFKNFEIKGKIQNKKLKSCASYNNIHINTESNNILDSTFIERTVIPDDIKALMDKWGE